MLRKKAVWIAVALLLLCFPASALATESGNAAPVSAISAYYLNNMVYLALRPNGERNLEVLQIQLQLGSGTYEARGRADAAHAVKYVLLLDLSTSMPHYEKSILSFADALLPAESEGITATVAGFGERFEILSEDITGREALRSELSALTYDHRATDICGGMAEALRYFSSGEHRGDGEMVHLILLTDGVPYLTGDPENENAAIEASAEAAAEIVSTASEVIVHTVYFRADRDEVTYSAVASGKGLHLIASDAGAASEAGAAIGQFAESLYEMAFPVDWEFGEERADARLVILDDGALRFVPVENLRNISAPLAAEEVARPTILNPEPEAAGSTPAENSSEETGTDGRTEVEAPSQEETAPSEEGSPSAEAVPSEERGLSAEKDPEEEGFQEAVPDWAQGTNQPPPVSVGTESELPVRVIALAAGAGMLLMALIVALVFLLVRRKSGSAGRSISEPGIPGLKLVVVSGRCREDGRTFPLRGQLLIGSAKSCDIVFSDPSVSGKSARVFLREQAVYIEDLNEQTNTSLGGMKIYAPNRLRSGDEIQIGKVCFRFLF